MTPSSARRCGRHQSSVKVTEDLVTLLLRWARAESWRGLVRFRNGRLRRRNSRTIPRHNLRLVREHLGSARVGARADPPAKDSFHRAECDWTERRTVRNQEFSSVPGTRVTPQCCGYAGNRPPVGDCPRPPGLRTGQQLVRRPRQRGTDRARERSSRLALPIA
jgi:hypothetical protein